MRRILALLLWSLLVIVTSLVGTPVAYAQFSDPTTQAPAWAQKRPNSLIPELRDAVWLVKAEAVEIINGKDAVGANMRITEVYCGPQQLVGEIFQVWGHEGLGDMHGYEFTPPMALHEKGIFPIKWNPILHGEVRTFPNWMCVKNLRYGMDLPIREKQPKTSHANGIRRMDVMGDAEHQAGLIRKIYELPDSQLLDILRAFSLNHDYLFAAWCMNIVVASQPDEAEIFLKSLLANPQLPFASQITVDRMIVKKKYAGWVGSTARFKLLESWFRSEINEKDNTRRVLSHLKENRENKTIDNSEFEKLIEIIMPSSKASIDDVLQESGKVVFVLPPHILGNTNEYFDIFLKELENTDDDHLKNFLLEKIVRIFSTVRPGAFKDRQKRLIAKLIEDSTDEKLKLTLRKLLNPPALF